MSTETTITTSLRCDTPASPHEDEHSKARTIRFSLDGSDYEREACADCELDFAAAIGAFLAVARLVSGQRRRTPSSRRRAAAVREWAASQGIALSDRGRIPASVIARYDAARGGQR